MEPESAHLAKRSVLRKNADGLNWPAGGRIFTFPGRNLPSGLTRGLCFPRACSGLQEESDHSRNHDLPAKAKTRSNDSISAGSALADLCTIIISKGFHQINDLAPHFGILNLDESSIELQPF